MQHKEEKSCRVWSDIVSLLIKTSIPLEEPEGVEVIRYAPSDRQGLLHIDSFLITNRTTGRSLDICRDYQLTEALCQNIVITNRGAETGYCMLCREPYGWFEISLDGLFEDGLPNQIEIEIQQSWQGS